MPILGGCLCFDLPTGTKIIGALYLISAIINTLVLTVINLLLWVLGYLPHLLSLLENASVEHKSSSSEISGLPQGTLNSDDYINNDPSNEELRELVAYIKEYVFPVKMSLLVFLILALLSVITSSMLIHGVRKNCRGLLVPWVLQEIIHILIALVLSGIIFWALGSSEISWTIALPMILCTFIQVFFIVVVVSQFQALGLIRMHDEMCMK